MRINELKYPGRLSNGIRLRVEAMNAINAVDRAAIASAGANDKAVALGQFFEDCANKARSVKTLSAVPVAAYAYNARKTSVIIEFNRNLSTADFPAAGIVFTPAKTVSNFAITGNKVVITITANVAAGFQVDYTQQGDGFKDTSANFVPTFSIVGSLV